MEAYMEHTVQNLEWYLETLSKEALKDICRNFDIKGFSSKNKDELVKLIVDTYFEDNTLLIKLLETLSSDHKLIFFDLAMSENNVTTFNRDIPDTLFLFYPEENEYLVIPNDVKAHFKEYIEAHNEIKDDMKQIEFYHSALNLYGFVSLKQLSKLNMKYNRIQMRESEVKTEIERLLPEYASLIAENSVKHRDLAEIKLDLKQLTHGRNYYEPSTLEAFLKYNNPYYTDASQAIDALRTLLMQSVSLAYKDTYTGYLIVNTIIFGLRANDTPEFILQHIEHIESNGFLNVEDKSNLTEKINEAINDSRLWSLNGHKKEQKKTRKIVQVKQKKKKRKKKK